ncbi:hypothetical protein B7494_g8083 [Chlorociboria aeruginascens]|nr:hypothetical protein B7494_g8083 [Chlorociboria aeruginascens]
MILSFYETDNESKQIAILGLIIALEPIIGVINVCLPFLPQVFVHIKRSQPLSRLSILPLRQPKTGAPRPNPRTNGIRADSSEHFEALHGVQMKPLRDFGPVHSFGEMEGRFPENMPWDRPPNQHEGSDLKDFPVGSAGV